LSYINVRVTRYGMVLFQIAMLVQPLRHRLQLSADFVLGEEIQRTYADYS